MAYSISNTATVDEITYSVLRIETIDKTQYGDYYCKASNKVGHAETRINLFGNLESPFNTLILHSLGVFLNKNVIECCQNLWLLVDFRKNIYVFLT